MLEKQALEIARSETAVEPETIRHMFPSISDEDMDKLMAFVTLFRTRHFWENFYIFENIVLALNDVKPDFSTMRGSTPEQIWYALSVAHDLYPTREYAPEILEYIKYMFNQSGVYIYPPWLEIANPYFDKAKELASNGPYPLGDNTPEEVQASKYLEIMTYLKTKE